MAERAMNLSLSFSLRFLSAIMCSWACEGVLVIEYGLLVPWLQSLMEDLEIKGETCIFICDGSSSFGFKVESKLLQKCWGLEDGELELSNERIWEEEEEGFGETCSVMPEFQLLVLSCLAGLSKLVWEVLLMDEPPLNVVVVVLVFWVVKVG